MRNVLNADQWYRHGNWAKTIQLVRSGNKSRHYRQLVLLMRFITEDLGQPSSTLQFSRTNSHHKQDINTSERHRVTLDMFLQTSTGQHEQQYRSSGSTHQRRNSYKATAIRLTIDNSQVWAGRTLQQIPRSFSWWHSPTLPICTSYFLTPRNSELYDIPCLSDERHISDWCPIIEYNINDQV